MKIACISDTHMAHEELVFGEDADVLVVTGDFTNRGDEIEVRTFARWLKDQPFRHKVVVAGNHDFLFERRPQHARELIEGASGAHYLQDQGVTLDGVKFWGSPWQPWFYDWAFNLRRGAPLAEKWALIPEDTNVLLTHGPPQDYLDKNEQGLSCGCEELKLVVERLRPALHVFGHIHPARGIRTKYWDEARSQKTLFVNASSALRDYSMGDPFVLDIGG